MCNKAGRQVADESADDLRAQITRLRKTVVTQAKTIQELQDELTREQRKVWLMEARLDNAHKYAVAYEI